MTSGISTAAVIGDDQSVLAFKALGLEVFIETDPISIKEIIRRLGASGCQIIFLSERLAANLDQTKYKNKALPIIIPIPNGGGSNGYGQEQLSQNIKKAIGTEIVFKD